VLAHPEQRSRPVLAATKLHVPPRRAGVPRERLVAALAAASEVKLILICAPAGSGKTTLLSEWHADEAERRAFAWLSLDASDNDTVRFLDGVITALRTAAPGVGEEALGAMTGTASLTDVVLPSLINDLAALGETVVLVLDDYHLISNERIHGLVRLLLEHLPGTLQPAIATRSQPPLAVERLRARRQLLDLGAAKYIVLDLERIGGITDFLAAAALCEGSVMTNSPPPPARAIPSIR